MSRVSLPESRLRARKRRRRATAAVLWVAGTFFAAGALAGLTYLPHWRIVAVNVSGVEESEVQAVKYAVHQQLKGRFNAVLPRNNVMFYPRESIEADLLKEFPTFAQVEVRAVSLRALGVDVVLRVPKAVWCGETRTAGSPCFLLDERGVVYESTSQHSSYASYFGKTAEGPLPKQYLNEGQFRSLAALVVALEEQQSGTVASVEVDQAGDVSLLFTSGFELKFALEDGGGDVYERFVLALEAEPFKGRQVSDFEYLDLRFGDRLYYKLKGE